MSKHFLVTSSSFEETLDIGYVIGDMAMPGTMLGLTGDLGSGKTALIQGVARGLQVPENYYVTSPSYTLVNEYPGRLHLFHLDLYRLSGIELDDIGLYDILASPSSVVAIEWADRLPEHCLVEFLQINIEITEEETRNLFFTAHGNQHVQFLTGIENRLKENLWH